MSNVTAKEDLNITVGAGTTAVIVKNTTAVNLIIRAHSGARDNTNFDLEYDAITNASDGGLIFDDAHGAGNDVVTLSHLQIANPLAMTLGGGFNSVDADHVLAAFGWTDGGEPNSGLNLYFDHGGNAGFYVYHFFGT